MGLLAAILPPGRIEVSAQKVRALEVHEQPIADVLLSLGKLYDALILPDETVTGTVSSSFTETALAMFLPSRGCYFWKENGLYQVPRLHVTAHRKALRLNVGANEVPLSLLVARGSQATDARSLYHPVEELRISIHAKGLPISDLLCLVVLQCPLLSVFEQESGYRSRAKNSPVSAEDTSVQTEFVRRPVFDRFPSNRVQASPLGALRVGRPRVFLRWQEWFRSSPVAAPR